MNRTRQMLAMMIVTAVALPVAAQNPSKDWPTFRGPSYDGTTDETGWQTDWSASKPAVVWQKNVGTGASSVAVVDGRLYTMGNESDQDIVWCLDAESGEVIWRQSYDCPLDKRMFEGGPAATPTVADGKVYTLSHQGHLNCFDAQTGKPIWSVNIVDQFGAKRPKWGFAGSPLVYDDKVILDTGSPKASTVALHKDTGRPIWASGNQGAAYATPVPIKIGGKDTIVCFKAKHLVGIDPRTGRQLWAMPWETSYDVNATPPIAVDNDKLFMSTGYNRGCALIRVGRGNPTVLWENREMTTQVNGVVQHGEYVYGVSGNAGHGDLVCMRLSDGKVMWRQGGYGTGSVILADGNLIVVSEHGGKLAVAPASPEGFKPTGELQGVVRNKSWVAPVLSHGRIYVKDNRGHLACVDVSGE